MFSVNLTNILYMTGGLAGLATVLFCVIKRQLYLSSDTVLFCAFLLLSWISGITAFGISLSFIFSRFICAWMIILAVYYVAGTVNDSIKLIRISMFAMSLGELLLCLFVLVYATRTLFTGASPTAALTGCFKNGRLCALWNANTFGFVCASLIFTSILGIAISKGWRRGYFAGTAFVGWFCLGLTGCRTGAVGVAAALGIVTFSEGFRRFFYGKKDQTMIRIFSVAAASLLITFLAIESFLLPSVIYRALLELFSMGTVFDVDSRRLLDDDGTFSSRTYIWSGSIRSFFRNPRRFLLGISPFSKEEVGGAYSGHHEMMAAHAHSTFLELMRIHGFLGLLIWIILMIRWGKTAAISLFDAEESRPVCCMAACAAGILVIGLAEPVPLIYSSSMYLTIPFFMICGLFEKLRREKK